MTRSRRFLQYSFVTMLVICTIVCCVCAWAGVWYRGFVSEQLILSSFNIEVVKREYRGPDSLELLLGRVSFFCRATDVIVPQSSASTDWSRLFHELHWIENIEIRSDFMNDHSLKGIENWDRLVAIRITGERFTSCLIRELTGCENLLHITLESIEVDREAIEALNALPSIVVVELHDCEFTNPRDLAVLVDNEKIIELDVRWGGVDPDVMQSLEQRRSGIDIAW